MAHVVFVKLADTAARGTTGAQRHPASIGVSKCTCPTYDEFARNYSQRLPTRSELVHVKITDDDCAGNIGAQQYTGVRKLSLHFECTKVPPPGERSFAAEFIVACPDLEHLELKGSADGSVIVAIAKYTTDRPKGLSAVHVYAPVMLGMPNMEDHNYTDGLGFNAYYFDSINMGSGGMHGWAERHRGNIEWTCHGTASPPGSPTGERASSPPKPSALRQRTPTNQNNNY